MVIGIKSKVGEMVENKVVSIVVLDLTNSHQKVRINAVQSESKLKNLEKEIKEKTISEMKESSYKESKTPRVFKLYSNR
jgi:predicted GIY-YIG superfamily endonuclease